MGDADNAIRVLEKEFKFIGLTEEWDISVCLFHKMFGGNCHRREFVNLRPGTESSTEPYSTDILQGFVDEVDGKFYAKARRMFLSNLQRFGVSRESCMDICSSFPDPFLPVGA